MQGLNLLPFKGWTTDVAQYVSLRTRATPSLLEKRLLAHPVSKQAQGHVTSTISVAATAAHE